MIIPIKINKMGSILFCLFDKEYLCRKFSDNAVTKEPYFNNSLCGHFCGSFGYCDYKFDYSIYPGAVSHWGRTGPMATDFVCPSFWRILDHRRKDVGSEGT